MINYHTYKFDETFLYHIWDEQHLIADLFSVDGKQIKVIHQGVWNTDEGPDFRNAIIKIDNKIFRGDVEIDLLEYYWKSHNHNENKNFNDTILHVVFRNDTYQQFTVKENSEKIPILVLENACDQDIEKLWKRYRGKKFTAEQQQIKCELNEQANKHSILSLIDYFGEKRLVKKTQRFGAELLEDDFNQILYEGILEALGYAKNKKAFLKFARFLPYKKLQKFCQDKTPLQVFSLLLGVAGFINDYNIPFIEKSEQENIKAIWHDISPKYKERILDRKVDWNFFRIRPANHPVLRLIHFVNFSYKIKDNNLINTIISCFSISEKNKCIYRTVSNNFIQLFAPLDTDFLHKEFRLGKSRADDIFLNIILPVVNTYAQKMGYEKLRKLVWEIYDTFPLLSDNYIVRYMRQRLSKLQGDVNKSKIQQGLIQIYYEYCQYHSCQYCLANFDNITKNTAFFYT
ncbi:MAG: DUF2851 domain-containing protein [Candidatus Cloacimonadota bacterium]|nr:MAG: DUF2851 domain-containing protein [Candidatus Cloacimonadota bacterium]